MTLQEQLHRSETHCTGQDPACPVCASCRSYSEKRRAAAIDSLRERLTYTGALPPAGTTITFDRRFGDEGGPDSWTRVQYEVGAEDLATAARLGAF